MRNNIYKSQPELSSNFKINNMSSRLESVEDAYLKEEDRIKQNQ